MGSHSYFHSYLQPQLPLTTWGSGFQKTAPVPQANTFLGQAPAVQLGSRPSPSRPGVASAHSQHPAAGKRLAAPNWHLCKPQGLSVPSVPPLIAAPGEAGVPGPRLCFPGGHAGHHSSPETGVPSTPSGGCSLSASTAACDARATPGSRTCPHWHFARTKGKRSLLLSRVLLPNSEC